MRSNSKQDLLHGNLRPIFLRYLFPSIAATVMISMNFFVDTLCIGQKLGELGLAALNFALPVTGLLYAIGSLLGAGGATLFSVYTGRGETRLARGVFTVCTIAMLVFSGTVMVLGLIFLPQVTTFLGGTGEARQWTMDYLLYVFLFAPFFTAEMYLNIFVRNDNAPRLSMAATFCGSSMNIVLDVLFVFVFEWGMAGASLATSLSLTVSTSVLVASVLRKNSKLRFIKVSNGLHVLMDSIRMGMSSFVIEMTGSIVTLTFNTVLMKLSGETAVAVYGVIANLTVVVSSSMTGVSNAMQPLVSINAGARRWSRVRQILMMALVSSFALGTLYVLIGELWPDILVSFFVQADEAFMTMACQGIRIVFLSYILSGANILFSVYSQSVQHPNEALLLSLLRGVISPVICVIGCAFFFGVPGVWASTVVAEMFTLAVSLIVFRRVQNALREKNYEPLGYFDATGPSETLDTLLEGLGAEDLTIFQELMAYCDSRDENREGIPAYLGLDDLTAPERNKQFEPAAQDSGLGLVLATGAMLFTSLYEQNDECDETEYPPVVKAAMALAEKAFRFEREDPDDDGDDEDFSIVPFKCVRETYPDTDKDKN